MDIHHPFVSEFPEHRETIRHLRLSDNRFRQMFEEYHQLDDASADSRKKLSSPPTRKLTN